MHFYEPKTNLWDKANHSLIQYAATNLTGVSALTAVGVISNSLAIRLALNW